jgi:hypothetical protein
MEEVHPMLLELSNAEVRELKQALESALRGLLDEIAHADQRAYRDMLRKRYDQLDQLQRRLDISVESDQVYA